MTTFIFSLIILKMKAERYQIVGSLLVIIGIGVVGAASLLYSDSDTITASAVFYCLLRDFKL